MVGLTTGGRCTSTINAIFYGETEPATAWLQRQEREWIQIWQKDTLAHDRLRQGWQDNLNRLAHMRPRGKWNSITGPMGALILSLQQLGWDPMQPD
eukprot:1947030-Pyramimonas_sp.AAC.1